MWSITGYFKNFEKSGNLSTGACPIRSLISENALTTAVLYENFVPFKHLVIGAISAEIANESSIERRQTVETFDFRQILGGWPILDSVHLSGINLNTLFRNYKTKKLSSCYHKWALVWINIELFSSQNPQYLIDMAQMIMHTSAKN